MGIFNAEELENLEKLADFLENEIKDEQFDLEVFRGNEDVYEVVGYISKDNCGTVGCALGWMPFVVDTKEEDFNKWDSILNFSSYCERVLGSDYNIYGDYGESGELLGYIFDDLRTEIEPDTNRMDAVNRIREVIKANGMTEDIREDLDRLLEV